MSQIEDACRARGITRLCHFTQSRNLAHILGDCTGILSRRSLENMGIPFNPTDADRFDGHDDLICCTIEYPNVFNFNKVRDQDHLFKDWVVLLIDPVFLWTTGTFFCPCNAATERGRHIGEGFDSFTSMFEETVPGARGNSFSRASRHLSCCPTNVQAEVLIPDPIGLEFIKEIVVEDEEQAKRELCRAQLQGLSIDKDILVIPEFFDRNALVDVIRNGKRIRVTRFNASDGHG